MAELNSHEIPNMYPNLSVTQSNDHHFRLNKTIKLKIILLHRELMSKRLSKYIASFDYFD